MGDWGTWDEFWGSYTGDDETWSPLPTIQTNYGPGIVGAVDENGYIIPVSVPQNDFTANDSPTMEDDETTSSSGFWDGFSNFFGDLGNIAAQGGKQAFQNYTNQLSGTAAQQQQQQQQTQAAQTAAQQNEQTKTILFGLAALLVVGAIVYKAVK